MFDATHYGYFGICFAVAAAIRYQTVQIKHCIAHK